MSKYHPYFLWEKYLLCEVSNGNRECSTGINPPTLYFIAYKSKLKHLGAYYVISLSYLVDIVYTFIRTPHLFGTLEYPTSLV